MVSRHVTFGDDMARAPGREPRGVVMIETGTTAAPAAAPPAALLRRGWMGVAQLAAIVAVVVGAGVAIYAERGVLRQGLGGLTHTRAIWVLAGAAAEFGSMAAF